MARSGGYLRSLGENAPLAAAGEGAVTRLRPAVGGAPAVPPAWVPPRPAVEVAGFGVPGGLDPNTPCARATVATTRMPRIPRRVLIADLQPCARAVWAAGHRTGRGVRYTPWCGRWPRSSGWPPAADPGASPA